MTRLCLLDTETSGVDPTSDRIVTLTLMLMEGDPTGHKILAHQTWLFNPECDIPEGATAVHGITTEHARDKGLYGATAMGAIDEIHDIIKIETADYNTWLCMYNAPFDATILESERGWRAPDTHPLRYFDHETGQGITVFDPLVAWKGLDRYRPGRRTLTDAAKAYGVPVDETKTHDASYDCYLTGQIALKQLAEPLLRNMSEENIHLWLRRQKRDQAESFQKYLRERKGETDAVVDPRWPIQA